MYDKRAMQYDKATIRGAKLRMRRVLLEQWDPIGIRDEPKAQDEYDGYLGDLYVLLIGGASEDDIMAHLRAIERDRMEVPGRGAEPLRLVSRELRAIIAGASAGAEPPAV